REHTRGMWLDGRLIAALRLVTHTVRLGEARLKMGGFAAVTTEPAFRGKGYMAQLMNDSMRYLQGHGYHIAALFGIADFYHRWGFASVLPEYVSIIEMHEADVAAVGRGKHRAIKPGDVPAVQRIHNRNDEETACSIIRIAAHISNRWNRWKHGRVITDDKGKVVAYFLGGAQGGDYSVDEVGVADYDWCPAVLNACMAQAKSEYVSRIRFAAPPTHPMARYLLQYRSDHEMHVSRNSNGMMAATNIGETLECMAPEWEALLMRAGASALCAEFTLVIGRKPWRIRAHRGAVDVAQTNGANKISVSPIELMQLLSGSRHLDEILALKRRVVKTPGMTLLTALFPKRAPYVWHLDRF
ncbi:MAG TPA: GNAT family N-acetyltransferase, partial [Candidatus Hydrogenedentes bacterium]|nr:GNAT family N-acetyltransferase [Candidatus Hydrogenedentota bacterium]